MKHILYIIYIHRYIHTSYINIIMLTTIINIFFGRCPECLEPQMLMISAEPLSCLGAWVWKEWPHNAIGSRWWNTNMVDFYIIPSWPNHGNMANHGKWLPIWHQGIVFECSVRFEAKNPASLKRQILWTQHLTDLYLVPTSVTQWYLWNISFLYNLSLNHGHPWTTLLLIHTFGGAGRASTLWPSSMCPVQRFHRCLAWNLVTL